MTTVFPPQWITNLDAVNDVGEGLLTVVYDALDNFGLADRYERRFVGHGPEAPVVRSKAKQLTVVCPQIFVGRAGEQQYQYAKGEPGKFAFQTAQFVVELSAPWPVQQGGTRPGAPQSTEIDSHRASLWRDGLVAFAAVMALAMGGIDRPWSSGSGVEQQMAVGPLTAVEPGGAQASWKLTVHVEL